MLPYQEAQTPPRQNITTNRPSLHLTSTRQTNPIRRHVDITIQWNTTRETERSSTKHRQVQQRPLYRHVNGGACLRKSLAPPSLLSTSVRLDVLRVNFQTPSDSSRSSLFCSATGPSPAALPTFRSPFPIFRIRQCSTIPQSSS